MHPALGRQCIMDTVKVMEVQVCQPSVCFQGGIAIIYNHSILVISYKEITCKFYSNILLVAKSREQFQIIVLYIFNPLAHHKFPVSFCSTYHTFLRPNWPFFAAAMLYILRHILAAQMYHAPINLVSVAS